MTLADTTASQPLRERPPYQRTDVPALIRSIEANQPAPELLRDRGQLPPYRVAHLLVRLDGAPRGWITMPFDGPRITAEAIDAQVSTMITDVEPPVPPNDETLLSLSAVVNTCSMSDDLIRTISSVVHGEVPPAEVIVVDNRPESSGVAEGLRMNFAKHSNVRYVSESRPGISSARNRGLAAATGDLVAFTDDDVVVDETWTRAITRAFATDPSVDCVTGLILPSEMETPEQVLIEEFGGYSKGLTARVFDLGENRVDSPLYPYAAGEFGSGANLAFRREALVRLGGFDPHLGVGTPAMGGEDLDIQVRVVLAGARLRYEPAAIIWHAHHRDRTALRRQVYGYGVGLGAYITKLVASAETRRPVLRRAATGARFHLSPSSEKNAKKQVGYPRSLTLVELAGTILGPAAYARSRLSRRRIGSARR